MTSDSNVTSLGFDKSGRQSHARTIESLKTVFAPFAKGVLASDAIDNARHVVHDLTRSQPSGSPQSVRLTELFDYLTRLTSEVRVAERNTTGLIYLPWDVWAFLDKTDIVFNEAAQYASKTSGNNQAVTALTKVANNIREANAAHWHLPPG